MIAMAIMMIAFASILMVQSSSLQTSMKSRQMNIVSMLARNKMIESELEWEGKAFSEIDKEKLGQFKAPYEDYRWKRLIKEVKFPKLNFGAGGDSGGTGESGTSDTADRTGKIITAYLTKAVREVVITITWKKGTGEQHVDLTTYWINLDAEFSLNE